MPKVCFILAILFSLPRPSAVTADDHAVWVRTPMAPPEWALLERLLLESHTEACRRFFERYFDSRGYLLCVERWGGDDGPDDAIENCNDWTLLHALGGSDKILEWYNTALEGHFRQYTEARTVDVPMARDGMYYKEFPCSFDWVHNGEGISNFNLLGLSDPGDPTYQKRVRRYAGFYINEDPGAPNYDPRHKIIQSLFNGSRGPVLRPATALDWAGDPIKIDERFAPRHGERNYGQMLEHFQDYTDIVGDHPQNLCATTLALNAYMLTHEEKYKAWLLEYVDAWVERTQKNNGIIPTNIGLDGSIGGATDGKWYGGVYGWSFSVRVPQTGRIDHRNMHHLGLVGFGNAYLLTGDRQYIDVWRDMIRRINGANRVQDGVTMYPRMYGDKGWYAFTPAPYAHGTREIYYWSMDPADLEPLASDGWLAFLQGQAPGYPVQALRADLESLRGKLQAMDRDQTTPDTRLSDDPMIYNPATITSLVYLMLGGLHPGGHGGPLHCRVRYFDPVRRRAGIPPDVGALVTGLTDDETELTLVNLDPVESRDVLLQMGAYGEHQCDEINVNARRTRIGAPVVTVRLAAGCGASIRITTRRYVNQPLLAHPWDRPFEAGTPATK